MAGKRIKEYLDANNMELSTIASKVNVSTETMQNICCNDADIDSVLYYKICKALKVPLETFLI